MALLENMHFTSVVLRYLINYPTNTNFLASHAIKPAITQEFVSAYSIKNQLKSSPSKIGGNILNQAVGRFGINPTVNRRIAQQETLTSIM